MEEVTKKEDKKNPEERQMDLALGRQPALLSPQGAAHQEPKLWGPVEAEAGASYLQDEALSIPGSAEEDEESEAVQAMALGLELQCRLQLHLDQLEAKAKEAAAAATAEAQGSSGAALGAFGGLLVPDPQSLACQGGHGEPHVRAQEAEAVLKQVPEEIKLGEKRGSEPFGGPVWGTGWYPREKGEIAAEAWGGLPTSSPPSVCQIKQLYPNLELKGQVPEGASTLELTHENCSLRDTSSQKPGEALTPLGEQLQRLLCWPIFAVPPNPPEPSLDSPRSRGGKRRYKLEARTQLQDLWQENCSRQRKALYMELRA